MLPDTVQQVYSNDLDHRAHHDQNQIISKVILPITIQKSFRKSIKTIQFHLDYHQSYQMLHARRGRGRILPATPNKPSVLQIPESDVHLPELNRSPTRVSGICGPIELN